MFDIIKKEIQWGGKKLTLETGRIARQADGAVLATYGETVVLCTVVASKEPKEGVDFLPLTVNYQEKTFAAGKIPGGFFKREARPSDKETLISRLIDRPIRPLFPENYFNETQVVCTLLNLDKETSPDIVAFVGASAALALAGAPVQSTVAAAKVGYIDKKFVLNPSNSQLENSDLELIVAGTKDGVLMVESEVKQLTEKIMLDAVMFAHKEFQDVIKFIETFTKGKKVSQIEYKDGNVDKNLKDLFNKIEKSYKDEFIKAYKEKDKSIRSDTLSTIRKKIIDEFILEDNEEITENLVSFATKKVEKELVRSSILKTGKRIDGRDTKTVRPIKAEVGILSRVHGSALFTRGETQALVVTTLGTSLDEQIIDDLEGEFKEKFMLHYNFPPYSVGEASMLRPPGRREIGHGKLAWRAIKPLMPIKDKFPYTIRVVSEITESNGSSSMATVCGTSLSLMDAGVQMINDISGLQGDGDMAKLAAERKVYTIIMHMKATPKTMQANPSYDNLMIELVQYLEERIAFAFSAGITREKIILDPGIGFGKRVEDNFVILNELQTLVDLGYPVLVGPSRKSFIGLTLDLPENDRLEGTSATITAAVLNGAKIVRVHDVKEMRRVVLISDAIRLEGAAA